MAKKQNVFKHNKDIALKLSVDLNARKEAFDSQCTGSGKTYVMKELVKLRSWKKFIVLGPSREVLERTKRTIGLKYTQAEYMTYQKLIRLTTMPGNLDAIIFDEAHRMGAPVWGAACDALRTSNPNAEVVGFTGTRIRGDKVDIAQAKFSGIVSAELTYQDAYHLGILKQPILVSAYFKAPNPIPSIIAQLQKLGFDEPTVKMEADALQLEHLDYPDQGTDIKHRNDQIIDAIDSESVCHHAQHLVYAVLIHREEREKWGHRLFELSVGHHLIHHGSGEIHAQRAEYLKTCVEE